MKLMFIYLVGLSLRLLGMISNFSLKRHLVAATANVESVKGILNIDF